MNLIPSPSSNTLTAEQEYAQIQINHVLRLLGATYEARVLAFRLLREFLRNPLQDTTAMKIKTWSTACAILGIKPSPISLEVDEAAVICSTDSVVLQGAIRDVLNAVPYWRRIYAEEIIPLFAQRFKLVPHLMKELKEFVKLTNVAKLSIDSGESIVFISAAVLYLFKRKMEHDSDYNEEDEILVKEMVGAQDSDDFKRVLSLVVDQYAKQVKRDPESPTKKVDGYDLVPGESPGTVEIPVRIYMETDIVVNEYMKKLYTPDATGTMAKTLACNYYSIRGFVDDDASNEDLTSVYIACIFIAECNGGTAISTFDISLICSVNMNTLKTGIERMECVFPRLHPRHAWNNEAAMRILAKRMDFDEDQVEETMNLAKLFSEHKSTSSKFFITRSAAALFLQALEYGHDERKLRNIVLQITASNSTSLREILSTVYSEFPQLRHNKAFKKKRMTIRKPEYS